MSVTISTTGTDVTINDLILGQTQNIEYGGIFFPTTVQVPLELVHPVVDQELLDSYTIEQLQVSSDLQSAIDAGDVSVEFFGDPVTDLQNDLGTLLEIAAGQTSQAANNPEIQKLREVFQAYDAVGGSAITGSEFVVPFNSTSFTTDNYLIANGEVTIVEAGDYEFYYYIAIDTIDNTGGANCTVEAWLEEDGAEILTSRSQSMVDEARKENVSKKVIHSTSAGSTYRVKVDRTEGNTNIQTVANLSTFIIKRIS